MTGQIVGRLIRSLKCSGISKFRTLIGAGTDFDPTKAFTQQLKSLIKTLSTHLHLELISANLVNQEIGDMLPKIHKPGHPGRPIITGVNTISEQISDLLEKKN